uniref:Glyco_transf_64 domain-containing protein n=1 Tax=Strongyloides papillosus TaxID=174720 RepID=A0A0N5B9S9_STREA
MKIFIYHLTVLSLLLITKSQNVDQNMDLFRFFQFNFNDPRYYYNIAQNNGGELVNQYQIPPNINKLIIEGRICYINKLYCLVSNTIPVEWDVIKTLFEESCIPILNLNQVTTIQNMTNNQFFEKAIIQRELFTINGDCSIIENELPYKFINISEKLYYGKKCLEERFTLRDVSYVNIKNSLITTLPLYEEDKELFSKSRFTGKIKFDTFTVLILTYRRVSLLKRITRRLSFNNKIDKIIIIWNDQNSKNIPKKSIWPKLKKPLYFVKTKKNSLNNRFLPLDIITTYGILSIDDDQMVNNNLLNKAFKIWQTNKDVLVGQHTRSTFEKNKIGYFAKPQKKFDLILTGLTFIHRKYLTKYTNEMSEELRNYVDKYMNCEDIVMNFLVAESSKKPNLFFNMKDLNILKSRTYSKGLSDKNNHYKIRDKCVKHLIGVYGKNPMKKSNKCLGSNKKKC